MLSLLGKVLRFLISQDLELRVMGLNELGAKNALNLKYAKKGDAGIDLLATSITSSDKYVEYGTGLAFEVPAGHVGLLFSRSSVTNKDLMLKNAVGVLDSSYRGEVKFRFLKTKESEDVYAIGDRIGQLIIIPYPYLNFSVKDALSQTERGAGGYGSTGK